VVGVLSSNRALSPAARKWFEESSCLLAKVIVKNHVPTGFTLNPAFKQHFPHLAVVRQPGIGGRFSDVLLVKKGAHEMRGKRVVVFETVE
jgi:hypothetical protein